MKTFISCSNHAISRVIERVKKIHTYKESHDYLISKFNKFINGTFNKGYIRKSAGTSGGLFIGNGVHRFIYEILGDGYYHIITYHIRDSKKYKKYKKYRDKCKDDFNI